MQQTDWKYLGREAVLILLLAYLILAGGTLSGMIAYPLRLTNAVLAGLLFGGWLLWKLLRKEKLLATGLDRAWIFFLGSQLLATVFSDDPRRSLPWLALWLSYALLFYLVYALLRKGWPAELVEKTLLISGSIAIALALYQLSQIYVNWRAAVAGLNLAPSFNFRISGVLGDPNLLAAFTNLLLPLALTRALASRSRGSQLLLAIVWLAGLAVVYFTDSRGGLLGLGMGLFIVGLGWMRILSARAREVSSQAWAWLRARRWLFYGLLLAVLVLGALVALRVLGSGGDTTHAPVASARDIYWQAAAAAFLANPVLGTGPGIYPSYLMQIWSTPPARPYLHAHSTPFNIGAESGIIGFFALFALLVAIWRKAAGGWREQDAAGKARWIGIAASLTGFSLHSLVDDFLPFSAAGGVLMILLALWLAPIPRPEEEREGASPLWVLAPALLAAVLAINPLRAQAQAEDAARQGNAGEWVTAAEGMQAAADLDPSYAIYWQQAAYAYGRAAGENPIYADLALQSYERATILEPVYSLPWANRAAVAAEIGLAEEAIHYAEQATRLAPEGALYYLNLGSYRESLDDHAAAQEAFNSALNLEPDWAASAFWTRSALRQTTLASFESPQLEPGRPLVEARQIAGEARAVIAAGDLEAGRRMLHEVYALNNQESELYLGLAELAMAEENSVLAEDYIQAGLIVQATTNQHKAEMMLLWAEIAAEQGEDDLALERYQAAFAAITTESLYGWGSRGWVPYNLFVFQRQGFGEDLMPQLERADIPIRVAERLLVLADLYEERGQVDQAKDVRAVLYPYLP
jgi:tetratricopeptide (TPR) repeat protein